MAADNQRDESEPLVEIDRAGNIYACGPTGSPNAAEYAQVSTDGGDSFHLLGTPPRGQQSARRRRRLRASPSATTRTVAATTSWRMTGLGPLTGFATVDLAEQRARASPRVAATSRDGVTNQGGAPTGSG